MSAIPAVPTPSPIIRVCRKRGADPRSALVLQSKRHKVDPLLFTLFKTADVAQIADEGGQETVIDFRSSPTTTAPVIVDESQNDNGNPLLFANDVVGEIGGPEERMQHEDNEVIMVNGRRLVPIEDDSADCVFDFYKISRGIISQTVSDEDWDMRFATKEEEQLLCHNDDSESDGCRDDEDDSNDEDNWRNDYPEEEGASDETQSERESIDGYCDYDDSEDDGLRLRMQRFGIGHEEYGSSNESDVDDM